MKSKVKADLNPFNKNLQDLLKSLKFTQEVVKFESGHYNPETKVARRTSNTTGTILKERGFKIYEYPKDRRLPH